MELEARQTDDKVLCGAVSVGPSMCLLVALRSSLWGRGGVEAPGRGQVTGGDLSGLRRMGHT